MRSRALTLARQHTREKTGAATSAAPVAVVVTPADGGAVKWRPKSYADKSEPSGAAGGAAAGSAPNIKDERAFPTLGRAISGLPPGARIMAPEKGLGALASRNQWADLAGGEGEEEGYGQGEEATPAAPAPTAAVPAAVEVVPDVEGPAAAALVRPPATAPLAARDADVREAVEKICVVSACCPARHPHPPKHYKSVPGCSPSMLSRRNFHAGARVTPPTVLLAALSWCGASCTFSAGARA